jgi:hypothetical protein
MARFEGITSKRSSLSNSEFFLASGVELVHKSFHEDISTEARARP